MFGTHDLLLFIVSGLLLNFTPGPDTLYIVGRSSTQGLRAGVTAALGIGIGIVVHILAAALGLSALLAASAHTFTIVKLIGAGYLIYVGISLLRSTHVYCEAMDQSELVPAGLPMVFFQGFLTNVLNPKVALFFLAFLPQFVDLDASNKPLAFVFLGAIFSLNGTLCNLFVAWMVARITGGLRKKSTAMKWFDGCIGVLFICLGLRLAFAKAN